MKNILKNNLKNNYYDHLKIPEILQFIENIIISTKFYDTPYLIISYGPPSSGKSLSRDFLIEKYALPNDYVVLDVDYTVKYTNLYDNMNDYFNRDVIKNINIDNMDDIIASNQKIKDCMDVYNEIRKTTVHVMDMLSQFILMHKRNACLEITCYGLKRYLEKYIERYREAGWKIYWIYPYTQNLSVLFRRSLDRLESDIKFMTKKFIIDCYETAKKNFRIILKNKSLYDVIIIYDTSQVKKNGKNFDNNILYLWQDDLEKVNHLENIYA